MSRKHTKEELIKKCEEKYGIERFDFSKIEYKNNRTHVTIICRKHGPFEITPSGLTHKDPKFLCKKCSHLSGGLKRRLSKEKLIEKCEAKYPNKFDYSRVDLSPHIPLNETKIEIRCKFHDKWFLTSANVFSEKRTKFGCPNCGWDSINISRKGKPSPKRRKLKDLIEKFNEIHYSKFDYTKAIYNGYNTPLEVICSLHGSFFPTPHNHLKGNGCGSCGRLMTLDEFINKSNNIHGVGTYDYSLIKEYLGGSFKLNIICKKHGPFLQSPRLHLQGKGCKKCKGSKGETKIRLWLESKYIEYKIEHKFNDCRNPKTNALLRYDFYLPNHNTLIEYDGIQHSKLIPAWFKSTKDDLVKRQFRDQIKTEYAKNNSIKLIRIPYTEKDIPKILNSVLTPLKHEVTNDSHTTGLTHIK